MAWRGLGFIHWRRERWAFVFLLVDKQNRSSVRIISIVLVCSDWTIEESATTWREYFHLILEQTCLSSIRTNNFCCFVLNAAKGREDFLFYSLSLGRKKKTALKSVRSVRSLSDGYSSTDDKVSKRKRWKWSRRNEMTWNSSFNGVYLQERSDRTENNKDDRHDRSCSNDTNFFRRMPNPNDQCDDDGTQQNQRDRSQQSELDQSSIDIESMLLLGETDRALTTRRPVW